MLTLVERILLLAELPLFAEIATNDLASLATVAREWDARPGELVHAQGDAGDGLHVVVAGRVVLDREGSTVPLGPGQAFGAWGLFDSQPRRFTATVREATRLLTLDREAFVDVMADHVNVSRGVLGVLAARLRRHALEGAVASLQEEIEIG